MEDYWDRKGDEDRTVTRAAGQTQNRSLHSGLVAAGRASGFVERMAIGMSDRAAQQQVAGWIHGSWRESKRESASSHTDLEKDGSFYSGDTMVD